VYLIDTYVIADQDDPSAKADGLKQMQTIHIKFNNLKTGRDSDTVKTALTHLRHGCGRSLTLG
jgi:hypothetical protein